MSGYLTKEQIEDLIIYCGSSPTIWRNDDMLVCCPVHGETHPSMGVSEEKQIFHCFACGAKGGFSKLLYLSLPDEFGYDGTPKTAVKADINARKFLAERYELEYRPLNKRLKVVKRYSDFQIINAEPVNKYLPIYKLAPFHSGKATYSYFFERGFSKEDVVKFKIGYDDKNMTVTIPVFDENNNLVGITGRYISKKRLKNERYKIYDNFKRSNYLYPENFLKVKNDTIILVEGQFDAIRCHKMGLSNTLALMTDSVSEAQRSFITDRCSKVIYIGDNDERGREASEKAYKLLKNSVTFLTVDFPDHGKDVCDWSDYEIREMLKTAHSPVSRKIRRIDR